MIAMTESLSGERYVVPANCRQFACPFCGPRLQGRTINDAAVAWSYHWPDAGAQFFTGTLPSAKPAEWRMVTDGRTDSDGKLIYKRRPVAYESREALRQLLSLYGVADYTEATPLKDIRRDAAMLAPLGLARLIYTSMPSRLQVRFVLDTWSTIRRSYQRLTGHKLPYWGVPQFTKQLTIHWHVLVPAIEAMADNGFASRFLVDEWLRLMPGAKQGSQRVEHPRTAASANKNEHPIDGIRYAGRYMIDGYNLGGIERRKGERDRRHFASHEFSRVDSQMWPSKVTTDGELYSRYEHKKLKALAGRYERRSIELDVPTRQRLRARLDELDRRKLHVRLYIGRPNEDIRPDEETEPPPWSSIREFWDAPIRWPDDMDVQVRDDRMTDLMAFGYKPRRVARPGAAAKPESEVAIEQERGVATEARVVEEIVVRPELLPRIEAWRQFG